MPKAIETTTKLKEEFRTVIKELKGCLPPEDTHLADRVHELFVSYRQCCADLRRKTEEAESIAASANQRASKCTQNLADSKQKQEKLAEQLADCRKVCPKNVRDAMAVAVNMLGTLELHDSDDDSKIAYAMQSLIDQLKVVYLYTFFGEWFVDDDGYIRTNSTAQRVIDQNVELVFREMAEIGQAISIHMESAFVLAETEGLMTIT